jgi:tetratricopeptide (TPR) repeat protein
MATIESPDQARTVLAAAQVAEDAHDHTEVIALLTPLSDSPHLPAADKPNALWMLAEATFATGDAAGARRWYGEVEAAGNKDYAESATGRIKLIDNEAAAGADVADGEVEGFKEIDEVILAGYWEYSEGRFESALALFTQAYKSDDLAVSSAVSAGFGLAQCLGALGRWAEAKEYLDYLRTASVGTNFAEAVDKFGDVADAQVGATAAADDGVQGKEVQGQLAAADSAFTAQDFTGASDLYYRVYQLDVVDGQTKALCAYWIGECFFATQAYTEARTWYTEATNASNLGFAKNAAQRITQLDQLAAGEAIVEPS